MKCRLLKEENYNISDWSGGKTKELSIFPHNSKYADREFIWRLSSATVDLDESDFTMLPDYNRVLMVLKGNVVLTYNDQKTVSLEELEQDSFDGAWKTKSYGRITDYNLMVRKGYDGKVDVIHPDSQAVKYEDTLGASGNCSTHALYCKEGYFLVNPGTGSVLVKPGELFLMEAQGETPEYTLMGKGVIVRAQIGYDYEGSWEEEAEEMPAEKQPEVKAEPTTEAVKEEQPSEKAAPESKTETDSASEPVKTNFAEEFKWCLLISNTQFRGAKFIFRKVKSLWYDEELTSKIRTLEKMYVTFIVFLLGILCVMSLVMRGGEAGAAVLIALAVWLVIDCLIVSPLIYYLALPKPIGSHIKNVSDLNEEEEAIRIKRENTNERVEKLLKKYEKSGRVVSYRRERDEDIE